MHRHHFPLTQMSINIARIATKDLSFILKTQKNTNERRKILFENLVKLKTFKYIPSLTNIFMLKNKLLSATELDKKLKQFGIVTSHLNITGIAQDDYLRITVRNEDDNLYFFKICSKINDELLTQS